jgi:lipopolysaccharide transport system ATP-binding protein
MALQMWFKRGKMNNQVIQIVNVSKFYQRFAKPHHRLRRKMSNDSHVALNRVSFSVKQGETVAIIGRNGSGKSTLLQIVAGTLTPTSGVVNVNGRVAALLELGAGFAPEFTGRENAKLSASLFGFNKEDWIERFEEIEKFADIGDYLDEPVKTYSSGMYARLGFAVAINVNPDILIVDEALAVGDEAFQRKCYAKLKDLQKQGVTILFVSHSAATVAEICDRAILLDRGELLMEAAPKIAVAMYQRLLYAPQEQAEKVRNELK